MYNNPFSRKYLAEFVYGSIDGTVTTFAIISAVAGAGLSPAIILVLGFANVLADGFSMAASNFLSQKSNEAMDMNGGNNKKPIKTAIITFLSFVLVGAIPVLPFTYFYASVSGIDPFIVSIIATALVFIFIGFVRGKVSGTNPVKTAVETLLIGATASVIAYGSGVFLSGLV